MNGPVIAEFSQKWWWKRVQTMGYIMAEDRISLLITPARYDHYIELSASIIQVKRF